MDKIEEFLTRGVANIIPDKIKLAKLLNSKKKLNIYSGFDATAPRLTLGHTVPFRKLQTLADLGHNVIFLIGDFTTLIGDNSDKETERPTLSTEEVEKNFKTYKDQASKILDFSKIKIKYNSQWLSKLNFQDVIKLCNQFPVGDFVGRELIRKRLSDGKRVGMHELLYPAMQGYDSYFMDIDLQIGATEQTFNMQAGRTLQKLNRNKESFVMTLEILTGTDGRKMSKSWGNAIWIDDNPFEMFTKIMAITDELIIQYYTLATNTPMDNINNIISELREGKNPMEIKKNLAFSIVKELHSNKLAEEARDNFIKTVQDKELPIDIPVHEILDTSGTASQILIGLGLSSSKSEAKRLIEQGGVEINNIRISNPNIPFETLMNDNEALVQVGKKRFIKVKGKI